VAAAVVVQPIEEAIEAVGTLAANERIEVKSEIDATITAIHFEEGQAVHAGQVLVELDPMKLKAALAEAVANLTMTQASSQRYAALRASGAVAQQEVDQTQAAWAANEALVERLTSDLEDATIKAPFDGLAGARLVSVGQFLARGTTLTTLIDPDPMKLGFRIPERHLGAIREGQAVKLQIAAYPEAAFTGEVYFIDPQIEEATRTVLIKARVPNAEGRLRQGMFARVGLIVDVREKALVIPESALLQQGDLAFVYVIDAEQKAQMRPVKVGQRLAEQAEILEGLQPGERVVTEGHQKLHPGAKVAARDPEAPAAEPSHGPA
jgi:membrane fusion protein (multidrug efflux system)